MRQYTIAADAIQKSGAGLESFPEFDCFEIVSNDCHPALDAGSSMTNDCHPALDAGSHERQLLTIRGLRVKPAMTEQERGLRVKPAMTCDA